MDPEMVPMMIFTVVVLAMFGGFIVLLPTTRRLGKFPEYKMAERQEFTERLLDKPRSKE